MKIAVFTLLLVLFGTLALPAYAADSKQMIGPLEPQRVFQLERLSYGQRFFNWVDGVPSCGEGLFTLDKDKVVSFRFTATPGEQGAAQPETIKQEDVNIAVYPDERPATVSVSRSGDLTFNLPKRVFEDCKQLLR